MPKPFQGLTPYIEGAADARGVDPEFVGPAKSSWHAKRVQDALGQLAEIDRNPALSESRKAASKRDAFARVGAILASAAAALDGLVEAARDVAEAHGLDASILGALDLRATQGELDAIREEFDRHKAETGELVARLEAETLEHREALEKAKAERAEAKPEPEPEAKPKQKPKAS